MEARIVGWGHTPFGRLEDKTTEDLILDAAQQAIDNAGIDPSEIDSVWVGHFNSGMVADGFTSSLALNLDESLRFTPSTRLENACASGSAAVYAAKDSIAAGKSKVTLVVGVEKMTELDTAGVTKALAGASYQKEEADMSFPAIFGEFAKAYFAEHGDHSETLAKIAAKNHTNAIKNPLAHIRKEFEFDYFNTVTNRNPMIAEPLRMTDCSLISDGAAALIMVSEDEADRFEHQIAFKAAVHVNDYLPMSKRDPLKFEGPKEAFSRAYEEAGVTVDDLDFAEVHDCFTIAELLIYEAMGLAEQGNGKSVIEDGTVLADGKLPINLSGGLKAKGHPVGATGVSMHVLAAMQLSGTAGDLQKEDAKLGCVFNMGGSGVANYCSILERAN